MSSTGSKARGFRGKRIGLGAIRKLAREIGTRYRPEKVILFGSYAHGRPGRDSDVDLLVILRTRRDPAEVSAEIACALRPPFPLDLLVRTPAEVRWRLAEGDCFLCEVVGKGKVVYEARHARVG